MEEVSLTPVSELMPRVERTLGRVLARLRALVPGAGLHHIGATALPGALTKGDVDVLVRVAPAQFPAVVDVLGGHFAVKQPANWTPSFASFGDDGFELPLGIQVVAEGGAEDFFLFLRDHFIANPAALAEYDRLKTVHAPDGAEAYWRAKAAYLGSILEGREARGSVPDRDVPPAPTAPDPRRRRRRMIRLAIPVLHVSSSAAAEAFYAGLGFRTLWAYRPDESLADPCYMGVERDGVTLHVSSFPGDGVAGGVVFLLVDDVDALHAEFVGRGVPIDLAPTDQTWGNREMYVRDPDSNSIRFAREGSG